MRKEEDERGRPSADGSEHLSDSLALNHDSLSYSVIKLYFYVLCGCTLYFECGNSSELNPN